MVESVSHFKFRRKFFMFFQGKNGNITHLIKGLKTLKILDFFDENTAVVTFKYPLANKSEFLLNLNIFENNILEASKTEQTFLLVYFCGDAWTQNGRIFTDMGTG